MERSLERAEAGVVAPLLLLLLRRAHTKILFPDLVCGSDWEV